MGFVGVLVHFLVGCPYVVNVSRQSFLAEQRRVKAAEDLERKRVAHELALRRAEEDRRKFLEAEEQRRRELEAAEQRRRELEAAEQRRREIEEEEEARRRGEFHRFSCNPTIRCSVCLQGV